MTFTFKSLLNQACYTIKMIVFLNLVPDLNVFDFSVYFNVMYRVQFLLKTPWWKAKMEERYNILPKLF